MNDKQKKLRFDTGRLPISEHSELAESILKDLELRLLREISDMGITVKAFSEKVGRAEPHIYAWRTGSRPAAISKIIEMGKRYK